MPGISITQHAYDRAKDRLQKNKKEFAQLAETAFYHGESFGISSSVKAIGGIVYIFRKHRLITVFKFPTHLINISDKYQKLLTVIVDNATKKLKK